MPTDDDLNRLVDAAEALDPQPRQRRWVSASFCILDAVYSIGARYDSVVVPVVHRVAVDCGIDAPAVPNSADEAPDPLPLGVFLDRYPDSAALVAGTQNKQRTSTRGGILKADAVLRHAQVLCEHEVRTLQDARELLADQARLEKVEADLRGIPGEGAAGVRRGYLWMLLGNDDLVKPDRMVLRWLARQGVSVSAGEARFVLAIVAERLSVRIGRRISAWELDHAIWLAARVRAVIPAV
ncbi:hypothetical protein C8K36_108113 [Rhodococcus sp. OK519]|uniref:hypothetical protein n=1 Tax=Rhodococcus sp. OK519 TaxID=2135729 RepID=UPI000D3DBCA7|nr:hypothetical protein C8K36_108113 [Rhodococcus sp. OK519]